MNRFPPCAFASKVTVVTAALAFVLAARAILVAEPPCQQPNPNTKLCYQGSFTICELTKDKCKGHVPEVENFPNGAIEADTGLTKEVLARCWRVATCEWNADTNECDVSEFGNWHSAPMTVVNSDPAAKCPFDGS